MRSVRPGILLTGQPALAEADEVFGAASPLAATPPTAGHCAATAAAQEEDAEHRCVLVRERVPSYTMIEDDDDDSQVGGGDGERHLRRHHREPPFFWSPPSGRAQGETQVVSTAADAPQATFGCDSLATKEASGAGAASSGPPLLPLTGRCGGGAAKTARPSDESPAAGPPLLPLLGRRSGTAAKAQSTAEAAAAGPPPVLPLLGRRSRAAPSAEAQKAPGAPQRPPRLPTLLSSHRSRRQACSDKELCEGGTQSSLGSTALASGSCGGAQRSPLTLGGHRSETLVPEHCDDEIQTRYEFQPQKIGSGGYGSVFLATDKDCGGRVVAVKRMTILDADMRQGFQKEVLIMKDLDHPNVCKVFESYDEGREVYLVMEYLEGGELFDHIIERDSLQEGEAADITRQVAQALRYAHGRGIAHRDLKPENVCFCTRDPADRRLKVIDWGVGNYFASQGGEQMVRMSSMVGSEDYAAPEVFSGRGGYTAACDLWSLGVVIYTMLHGEPPFRNGPQDGSSTATGSTECPWSPDATRSPFTTMGASSGQQPATPEVQATGQGRASPISCEARQLIRGLLQRNPGERLSIGQVLAHPWLQRVDSSPGPAAPAAAPNSLLADLRRCAVAAVGPPDALRLDELHRTFAELDANRDGKLTLHEVRAGFVQVFGSESSEVRAADEFLASFGSIGVVEYAELCAPGFGMHATEQGNAASAAFSAFDMLPSLEELGLGSNSAFSGDTSFEEHNIETLEVPEAIEFKPL